MNAATRDTVRAAPDGLAPPGEGNDATDEEEEEEGEEEEEEAAGSTAAAAAASVSANDGDLVRGRRGTSTEHEE